MLANPVSAYLSHSGDDSVAQSKLKATIEDLGLSSIAGLALKTFSAAKSAMFGKTVAPVADDATKAGRGRATSQQTAQDTASTSGLVLSKEHTDKLAEVMDGLVTKTEPALAQEAGKEGSLTSRNCKQAPMYKRP